MAEKQTNGVPFRRMLKTSRRYFSIPRSATYAAPLGGCHFF